MDFGALTIVILQSWLRSGHQPITLRPLTITRFRRLTNFHGPDDAGYRRIVAHIRDEPMFKAVQGEKFKELQKGLVKAGSPVNAKDEQGLSLLHRAVQASNFTGVDMLLVHHANLQVQDRYGQTPLHCAIKLFFEDYPDDTIRGDHKVFMIIQRLLDYTKRSELYNNKDICGMTVHDTLDRHSQDSCLDRHDAIRELIGSHQPSISRRPTQRKQVPWKGWSPPVREGQKRNACNMSKAIVAEFYKGAASRGIQLPENYRHTTIFELIYDKDLGPSKAFRNLNEWQADVKVCCRWIHVPANNVSTRALH